MIARDFTDQIPSLYALAWPLSSLGEVIEIVARQAGLLSELASQEPVPPLDPSLLNQLATLELIEILADPFGLEVEAVEAAYGELLDMVRNAPPALLQLPNQDFLALLSGGKRQIRIIAPDLSVQRIRPELIRALLIDEIEAPQTAGLEELLAGLGVAEERRTRAKIAILDEQLSETRIGGCYLLRLSPATAFRQQLYYAGLPRQVSVMIGGYAIQQVLVVMSGWVILQGSLQGRFSQMWLLAWGLLLFTNIPFQVLVSNAQNNLTIGMGLLFKKRLLAGSLELDPEEIRHQGAGQFLGRLMEAEAVEWLALSGGFAALIALIQLIMAGIVLTVGTTGSFHVLLLLLWTIITLLFGWRYYHHSQKWLKSYRDMSNDLVERMVGHRTRLAQENVSHWHDEEDQILDRYLKLSEKMDRHGVQLSAFINRGWLILALAGLIPTFVFNPASSTELAISLGGIMLASNALRLVAGGLTSVVGILNAWEQFAPIFMIDSPDEARGSETGWGQSPLAEALALATSPAKGEAIILARDIAFSYHEDSEPVLTELRLRISYGERLLLEGPSGGGKSTLVALLAGLRTPDFGLLLLQGLDLKTMGSQAWRQRIASVPQFHENHVLTDTFAFNLLMGRRWPASPQDLAEAEIICRELGLGELIERMPAGMQQMVGESGWQLSHGERSRLYIARALLQNAYLIILDESFAALDPENLERALRCVLKRAPTLLTIAHP
jgi:ATP-binding cassette subfamily B protein